MDYICEECGGNFPSENSLGGHVAQNHRRGEYDCPSCDRKFDTKTGLGNHHYYTHGESLVEEKKGFECPWDGCEREFGSNRAVKVHHKKKHGKSISENKCICQNCGKEFIEMKGNDGKFCEEDCYFEWERDRVTRPCEYCGKDVTRKRSTMQWRYIFCSENHKHQYQKEYDDYHPDSNSFEHYRGPNWKSQRRKALQRDNNQCQVCGTAENTNGKNMAVHHIIPFKDFEYEDYEEANSLDNLICLCDACHIRVERGVIDI